jgi:hypothetical protein
MKTLPSCASDYAAGHKLARGLFSVLIRFIKLTGYMMSISKGIGQTTTQAIDQMMGGSRYSRQHTKIIIIYRRKIYRS